MIMGLLNGFFQKIYLYHFLSKDHSDNRSLAGALGVPPFFIDQYKLAARNYPVDDLEYIFTQLKHVDLKLKGVNTRGSNEEKLFGEMIYQILSADKLNKINRSPKWNVFLTEEY